MLTRHTMLSKNSIQARLGGVCLPTAIKESNKVLANFSDLVTVKHNNANTISVNNSSVIEFEIFASSDSGVHQTFDLTHGLGLVDLLSMAGVGAKVNPLID